MFDFPSATVVHRRMPKEAFYKNLSLSPALKDKFVSDIDRIYVENSFTQENLNLTAASEIEEILLLSLTLKNQSYDSKIIEAIARQNLHKLIFQVGCGDKSRLVLYQGKLYQTQWQDDSEMSLKLDGFSLDDIWNSFVEQIALYEERADNTEGLSMDERLALQAQILRLEKLIEKTENAAWKEQQPKKQFELYTCLRGYRQELEELKNGKA